MTPELFSHQKEMVRIALENWRYAFFADPGTGKTRVILEAILRGGWKRVVVVCPRSIIRKAWLTDAEKFTPSLRVIAGSGTRLQRSKAMTLWDQGKVDLIVVNYESFQKDYEKWKSIGVRVLILDESTKIKNPTTKTAKCCLAIATKTDRAYVLTGCPTPNSMIDIWAQMACVNPLVLSPYFYAFRSKYFFQPNPMFPWLWKERLGAREEILKKIEHHSIRVSKEECLDLPEQMFLYRETYLSPKEGKMYRDFVENLIVKFQEHKIVGMTALTELAKSRQMLAGVVHTDDGAWIEVGHTKLDEMSSILEELGDKQVLILGAFRFEIERIDNSLRRKGKTSAILYGGLSETQQDESIQGFIDGRYQYLVCHPAAMAHGLTFVNCSNTIWMSLPFSYEQFLQTNARTHRIGQKSTCNYHILFVPDSVDERVIEALSKKQDLSLEVLGSIKKLPQNAVDKGGAI